MKQKVKVFDGEAVIYKGRVIEMPIKSDYVTRKSVELFDDEDPCIIHQSFVYKEYGSATLELLKSNNNEIKGKDFMDELSYLDFPSIETITIVLQ